MAGINGNGNMIDDAWERKGLGGTGILGGIDSGAWLD